MEGRSCGVGCLTASAVACLSLALSSLAAGEIGGMVVFLIFTAVPAWAVWNILQAAQKMTAEQQEALRARQEKAILDVAMRNGGRVTPALAAMNSRELSIAAARTILSELATEGLCVMDSDDKGHEFFQFAVNPAGDLTDDNLSADEWVASQTRSRMTGRDDASRTQRLDD